MSKTYAEFLPFEAAQVLLDNGLSFVPVGADKRAIVDWKPYQSRRPTLAEAEAWADSGVPKGWAIVCGAISGNLEVIDFDDIATGQEYVSKLVKENPDLATKLTCFVKSPRPGLHLYYRSESPVGGHKIFAKSLDNKVAVESRSEGNYIVSAFAHETLHRKGRRYDMKIGDYSSIPVLTTDEIQELHARAVALNKYVPTLVHYVPQKTNGASEGERPGDLFNARASWDEILTPHGWRCYSSCNGVLYWTRPGKSYGLSATTGHCGDHLYVFSSSTIFESDRAYSKFAAYTILNFNGDYSEAAKSLAQKNSGPTNPKANPADIQSAVCQEPEGKDSTNTVEPDLGHLHKMGMKDLEWLWYGRLGVGKLNLLAGEGGIGKGLLAMDMIARITTGKPFPVSGESTIGEALILSAEDSLTDTIKPRLYAAGADLSKVLALRGILVNGQSRLFDLATSLDQVRKVLDRHPGIKLIFIDPLDAYLPDGFREEPSHIRRFLQPIVQLAEETGVSILAMRHNRKASGSAKDKIAGHSTWLNTARSVWGAIEDKEDPSLRHFYQAKKNLTEGIKSLTYTIEPVCFANPDNPSGKEIRTARIVWGGETDFTGDELLAAGDSGKMSEGVQLLQDLLADGPRLQKDILSIAQSNGISAITMRRAKAKLNVSSRLEAFQGAWEWCLPRGDQHCDSEGKRVTG